ncbi:MAG: Two component domain sensor and regulator [Frankiales bacterium]|jgi:GAF domain-containing protein/sugar diacid utilization regulator|nr:Two component domain sensor and regulator [Frankiales bacterium]
MRQTGQAVVPDATPVDPDVLRAWLRGVADIAAAVTGPTPLPALLDLVTRTACGLMGYEFSSVMLADEENGILDLQGSHGLSPRYREQLSAIVPIPLQPGPEGPDAASLAFSSQEPVTVEDVTLDRAFTPWLELAREQGYRSFIAVPLMVSGRAVGTLNCYRAQPYRFKPDEILLLAALAHQAGTAIETARLRDRERDTIADQQALIDSLTQAEQIHRTLTAVALRAGGVQGLAAALAGLLERPVLIEDAAFQTLASADHAGRRLESPDPGARVGLLAGDAPAGWQSSSTPFPGGPHTVRSGPLLSAPVALDDDLVARLWLPGRVEDLGPLDRQAIEHAVTVCGLELLRERAALDAESALRRDLLAELLSARAAPSATLSARSRSLGHDLSWPHAVLVVRRDDGSGRDGAGTDPARPAETPAELRALLGIVQASARTTLPRPLVTSHGDGVVVLWPEARDGALGPLEAADLIRHNVARGMAGRTVSVAAGSPCADLGDCPGSFRMLRSGLELARRQGHRDRTVTLPALGIYGLLLQLDQPDELSRFAQQTLAPLRAYDRAKRTDLLDTLGAYLAHNMSTAQTAAALYLHPNTVGQRLKRIEMVLGLSLAQPEALVQLKAALMADDVLRLQS